MGNLMEGPSNLAERQRLYELAFKIDEELVSRFPSDIGFADDLAFGYERLGDLAKNSGDYAKAEELFGKQYQLAASLVARAPDRPASHWAVFCSLGQLSAMREQRGNLAAQAMLQVEALRVAQRLFAFDPDKPEYLKALTFSAASLAAHQVDAVLPGAAISTLRDVEPLMQRLAELDLGNHDRQRDLASFYLSLASTHHSMHDFAQAERHASQALDVLDKLPANAADQPDQLRLLLIASRTLAVLACGRDDYEAQIIHAKDAIGAANALEEKLPDDATTLHTLADLWAMCEIAEFCDPERAETLARRSIERSRGAIPRPYYTLALSLQGQAKPDDARDAAHRALALLPQDDQTLRPVVEQFLTGPSAVISDGPQGAKAE